MSLFNLCVSRVDESKNSQNQGKVMSLNNDHKVKVHLLVAEQTKEWSDMVLRQLVEEHDGKKDHIVHQHECLRKLLIDAQTAQLKELEVKQDR